MDISIDAFGDHESPYYLFSVLLNREVIYTSDTGYGSLREASEAGGRFVQLCLFRAVNKVIEDRMRCPMCGDWNTDPDGNKLPGHVCTDEAMARVRARHAGKCLRCEKRLRAGQEHYHPACEEAERIERDQEEAHEAWIDSMRD